MILGAETCGCTRTCADPEYPHHLADGGFRNPHASDDSIGFGQILGWQLGFYDETASLPRPPADFTYPNPRESADPGRPRVTWINHSSFLVEAGGVRFLTDPIWSERASPVSWAGPRRRHPVPIALDGLGRIDFVVISHNHFDHLDLDTVRRLGNHVRWFVPLGLGSWFRAQEITRIEELDWWQRSRHDPVAVVTAVPAQHFSLRSPFDLNETLWVGWVVELTLPQGKKTVYFAGDTGYNFTDFREIGRRFGSVDLSLLPIGAYSPRRLLQSRHLSPEEAVMIHRDVGSALSVAMHFGTFKQTDEPLKQPPYDLWRALRAHGVSVRQFRVLEPGQAINF
jgi:N-acyl-phosphatidylethanolamine-hydrolysing phospholipase D